MLFPPLPQGGNFWSGALSGLAGSAVGSATGAFVGDAGGFWQGAGTVVAGGVAGGISSSIAGGNFWDGVRNGVVSAALNHVAHRLQQVDPGKLKARILKDGKLTLWEANRWYRHGGGVPLTVDAAKVDLDFVNPSGWAVDESRNVHTLLESSDGLVYGQLELTYRDNNQFSITDNMYDFDMHRGTLDMSVKAGLKLMFRNAATNLGGALAGNGTPFNIFFEGLNTVNTQRINTNPKVLYSK